MPKVEDRHWAIWGLHAREQGERRLDFRARQSWYIEGLSSGYRTSSYRDLLGSITPEEEDLAESIGQAVIALGRIRPKLRLVLMAWWRAFPGAPASCERCCQELGVSRRYVYMTRDNARSWCEAYIEFRASGGRRSA